MIIASILFYLFSFVLVASAIMVIASKNPVHSVLFLIFGFFNAAGLFILLQAELIAMLLVIVYVGAVAVLFLFVVMLLDINFTKLREGFMHYLPLGIIAALVMFAQLFLANSVSVSTLADKSIDAGETVLSRQLVTPTNITNTEAIGRVLYTDYVYLFQFAGLILLVAMIGAIVLTLRHRDGVKRQNISKQVSRKAKDCIEIVKVNSGEGVG